MDALNKSLDVFYKICAKVYRASKILFCLKTWSNNKKRTNNIKGSCHRSFCSLYWFKFWVGTKFWAKSFIFCFSFPAYCSPSSPVLVHGWFLYTTNRVWVLTFRVHWFSCSWKWCLCAWQRTYTNFRQLVKWVNCGQECPWTGGSACQSSAPK